ncbi:hypothetical protein ACHAPT_009123 [Fusarium lateritium]
MSQCIRALFRIVMLVRKAGRRDRFQHALHHSDPFEAIYDIDYVKSRHSKLNTADNEWLAKRLGEAIAKRRQFIAYCGDHNFRLGADYEVMDGTTEKQSSRATTILPERFIASNVLDVTVDDEDDNVSLMTASTTFDGEIGLRLPRLNDLSPDGLPFECPICFTFQSFQREKSWKLAELGRNVPASFEARDCPFCDDWAKVLQSREDRAEDSSIRVSAIRFKRHVATHQEQLALFAVPLSQDETITTDSDDKREGSADGGLSDILSEEEDDREVGIQSEGVLAEEIHEPLPTDGQDDEEVPGDHDYSNPYGSESGSPSAWHHAYRLGEYDEAQQTEDHNNMWPPKEDAGPASSSSVAPSSSLIPQDEDDSYTWAAAVSSDQDLCHCGKAFRRPSDLAKHQKYHIKYFSCLFSGCDKAFATQKDLTRHMRTHRKGDGYQCKVEGCRKAMSGHVYSRKDNFDRHMRTAHPELSTI